MSTLSKLLSPGMVVCDVGSHLGYYTLAMSNLVGRSGRVFAFEPLPEHVVSLRETLLLNRLAQVTVVPQAVGEQIGLVMFEERFNDSMSSVSGATPSRFAKRCLPLPMTTLDRWYQETGSLDRLDLIKLDVEGQELAALHGAQELLACFRPTLICEIHRRVDVPYYPGELIEWLQTAGYEVSLIPTDQRPAETLVGAVARLESARLKPGWMAVAHILAVASS